MERTAFQIDILKLLGFRDQEGLVDGIDVFAVCGDLGLLCEIYDGKTIRALRASSSRTGTGDRVFAQTN